jgi:hypothetical protein
MAVAYCEHEKDENASSVLAKRPLSARGRTITGRGGVSTTATHYGSTWWEGGWAAGRRSGLLWQLPGGEARTNLPIGDARVGVRQACQMSAVEHLRFLDRGMSL